MNKNQRDTWMEWTVHPVNFVDISVYQELYLLDCFINIYHQLSYLGSKHLK